MIVVTKISKKNQITNQIMVEMDKNKNKNKNKIESSCSSSSCCCFNTVVVEFRFYKKGFDRAAMIGVANV